MRCPVLFSMWAGRSRRRNIWAGAAGGNVKILLPETEAQGLARGRGAKRGGRRVRGMEKSGGGNVKILLPETEAQGFAGSGEQREEAAECAEG